jgi:hypothetical protein
MYGAFLRRSFVLARRCADVFFLFSCFRSLLSGFRLTVHPKKIGVFVLNWVSPSAAAMRGLRAPQ